MTQFSLIWRKAPVLSVLLLFASLLIRAQNAPVTGKVSQSDGTPLAGVSVVVKGTSNGTATDATGHFRLSAPPNSILVFSYVGFLRKEVPVGNRTTFNVILEEDSKKLDEVVVVGYGQFRRRDITGSISKVRGEDIRALPVTNAQQALQGRAPGVDVVTSSNKPGSEPQVRIRGNRSFSAGNDPLYVVDGIPLAGGISDINPQDIESIEILKDASATAIYGSRGANGVVLISTRHGKTGEAVVSYDAYYGNAESLGRIDVMNGPQFAEYKRESRRATGNYNDSDPNADKKLFEPVELESILLGRTTDYQGLLLRKGIQTSHQLGVTGGTDKTKYAISFGYFKDDGIVKGQDYTRYNVRINLDQQIGKYVKVGTASTAVLSIRDGEAFNPIGGALQENPLGVPYDKDGNLIFLPTTDGLRTNPVYEILPGNNVDKRRRIRLFNSMYGEVQLNKDLKFRLNFGPDITQDNRGTFQGRFTNARRGGDPTAAQSNFYRLAYTVENILTYNKTFRKNHVLNVTALYSFQSQRDESSNTSVLGVPVETQQYFNLGAANQVTGVGSNLSEFTIASWMGRVNYTLRDKYLLTVTGRADGSSRFAPGHKWSFFPSFALGWNLINESFISRMKNLSNLKLRFSYGQTGNTDISPYLTQGSLSRTVYAFGNNGAFGYRPNEIPNPNLKWESTASLNLGVDFGFFNDRVYGSVDVYRQHTTDLLLRKFLPISNGFNSILQNVGSTENKGVEIQLSTVNIKNKNFTWTTDFTWATNQEKILELFSGQKNDIGNGWFIGYPIRVYYDYKKIGIWQTEDAALAASYKQKPGEIRVADVSGPNGKPDGKIDANDRVILGTQQPKWTGSVNSRFIYRNFDLSVFVFARVGGMIRSRFHDQYNTLFGRYNNLNVNYWTPKNPTNDFPRPNQNQEFPIYSSSMSYFDGSFVKIRNITLGYTFTSELARKLKLQSLRFYLSAQQPFIFAPYRQKYKGIDPEEVGEVTADTPSSRLLLFGLNARF